MTDHTMSDPPGEGRPDSRHTILGLFAGRHPELWRDDAAYRAQAQYAARMAGVAVDAVADALAKGAAADLFARRLAFDNALQARIGNRYPVPPGEAEQLLRDFDYTDGEIAGILDRDEAERRYRHRECGPDCAITGDRCEDADTVATAIPDDEVRSILGESDDHSECIAVECDRCDDERRGT